MTSSPLPKVITRNRQQAISAYVLGPDAFGLLEPAAVFRPRPRDTVVESVVAPGLERAVYTTHEGVVCVDRDGEVVWIADFEPRSTQPNGHAAGCAVSRDGRTVWVYRPDAMAERAAVDQWVAHDADTGEVLARRELKTFGHGGSHFVHPVDGSVYLEVAQGQDGVDILRSTAGPDGEPEFTRFPWGDRCLIGLAPDGRQFMTVDHGQADVAFHSHPGGDVLVTVPVEAFEEDPEDTCLDWNGGYLTPDLAVVTLVGEDEDGEEWFRHHLVDVRTGTPRGEFPAGTTDPYALTPLGDGSFLTDDPDTPDGNPVRRAYAPPAS